MKIIIAGSRNFSDYQFLKDKMDNFLKENNIARESLEIVSGTARGADILGERYATDNKIRLTKFPAKWNIYGKSAGFRRNEEMAEYADVSIVFCINNSAGSLHMHRTMKAKNKLSMIFHIW